MNGPIYMLSFFPTSYTKENIQNYTAHHKNNMLCMTILYTQYTRQDYEHATLLCRLMFFIRNLYNIFVYSCSFFPLYLTLSLVSTPLFLPIFLYGYFAKILLVAIHSSFTFLIFSHGAIHRHHHH